MLFSDFGSQRPKCLQFGNQKYQIEDKIGEGGFSKVYRAKKNDTTLVALSLMTQFYVSEVDHFQQLKKQKWRHCVLPKEVFKQDRKHLYIESELYDGDISQYQFTEQTIDQMILHISTALADIHSGNFIHCDVKPLNILYKRDAYSAQHIFSLCDFGVIRKVGSQHEVLGTVLYMSPESNSESQIDTSADIWAFGLTIYEIIQGQSFFQENNTIEDIQKLKLNQEYHEARKSLIKNVKYRNLIENTVNIDKNKRMKAYDIIQYISDVKQTIPKVLVPKVQVTTKHNLQLQKPINFANFIEQQKYSIPNIFLFKLKSENIQQEQQFKCKIVPQIERVAQNQNKKIIQIIKMKH